MKFRCKYIIHSLTALIIGLAIYILFRRNTYIHSFLNLTDTVYLNVPFYGDIFIKFQLPDFLWGYSLTMALYAVLLPKNSRLPFFITIFFGTSFEILQHLHIVSGTFDFLDCIMYFLAALISNIVYNRSLKNEKIS